MKGTIKNIAKDVTVYLVLCAATFLMLKIIIEYYGFDEHAGFLQVKQDYLHIKIWKTAFYIHVFSSIFTLLAGFTQFSSFILKNYKPLHRIMGRIYVADILLVNFPAGMIMAFYANGEWPSKIAFIILDSLWFWFTLRAYLEIRRGDILAHKTFMIRSFALTFSAITLRTWKLVLSNTFIIEPQTLYMIDAWMGFVPNLLFAEWFIRNKMRSKKARPSWKTT